MGRFSPTVQADYGPGLDIAGALEAFHRGRDRAEGQKHQRLADALQALQLQHQGIHEGQAPTAPAPVQYTVKPGAFDPATGMFTPSSVIAPPNAGMSPLVTKPGVSQLGTSGYYQDQNEANAYAKSQHSMKLADLLDEYRGKAGVEAEQFRGQEQFKRDLTAPDRTVALNHQRTEELAATARDLETRRHNAASEGQGHFTGTTVVGPDGKPVIGVINTRTGQVNVTDVKTPPKAPGGATGTIQQARIDTAAGQAKDADATMRAYEDKVLGGHARFELIDAELAKRALKGSTVSERMLNAKNPELAAYVRGAKAVAAAERLITPRGGSNALMGAEAMLSGAGPGATPQLIEQARGYRSRLVQGLSGHSGQTPEPAHPLAPSIDDLIRQGKTDAEIKAILGGHQ